MQIYDLDEGSEFTFQQDSNRPKDTYWFRKMDGMYAQVFSTEADMKTFNKPAFVSGSSVVEKVKNE